MTNIPKVICNKHIQNKRVEIGWCEWSWSPRIFAGHFMIFMNVWRKDA